MPDASAKPRRGFRNVAATIFLGLFTALGLLATVAVAIDFLQGVDTYFWQETSCVVEASRAVERPEYGDYVFEVTYRYHFRGEQLTGSDYRHGYSGSESPSDAQRLAARYAPGSEVACWVDPDEPARAYLLRANLWRGFLIFVPLLFVAVGGGSLWLVHSLGRPRQPAETKTAPAKKRKPFKAAMVGVAFFGVFFLFGIGFLVPFFVWPALQVVEARSWRPVPCEIVSSGVRTHSGEDGSTYSVEALYRYELGGREYLSNRYQFMSGSSSGYESKAEAAARIPAGETVTCYVDPDDPFEAVIERGFTGDYFFGLIPLLFALVGAGGMATVIWGARSLKKEAGRTSWTPAATAIRPGRGAPQPSFESPPSGESGPITLEPTMGRLGKLGCATAIALFWNGVVSLFVWQLVQAWRAGESEWFVTIVLIPFVLIGLLLLTGIPYGILALANPRPRLRLSRGAIPAGGSAQIEWSFRGFAGRIRRLRIYMAAEKRTTEVTTHSSGGSIRIQTEPLEETRIDILDRGGDQPLAAGAVSFTVPTDAPPTSEGDPAVRWKLRLQGEIRYWPDVAEEYEVVVLPFAGFEPSTSAGAPDRKRPS